MKKKIKYIVVFFLILPIFFIIYLRTSLPGTKDISEFIKYNVPKNIYVLLRFVKNYKINTLRNSNDYNVKFLPETQTIKLNFDSFVVKDLSKEEAGYLDRLKRQQFSFYIDKHNDNLFIVDAKGHIFYTKSKDLEKNKFTEIFHSHQDQIQVRDFLIKNDNIYVSATFRKNECNFPIILKSVISYSAKLDFSLIFKAEECGGNVEGGRISYWKDNGVNSILLTTSADILKHEDEEDTKPQNDKSIFGKILIINEENKNYRIFSKGHRNSLGLYADSKNNIILNTENGPHGGDEINSIIENKNYGWNISSYGKKYKNSNNNNEVIDYKLSHEDFGFEEPIFSFIPSIGITELIKINNNFSNQWQNNFLVGSLWNRHLYRLKFDNNFSKLIFNEKIYIGERIRDIFYLEKEKKILLALEETGSIGILTLKND